jgi:hypothetical protein
VISIQSKHNKQPLFIEFLVLFLGLALLFFYFRHGTLLATGVASVDDFAANDLLVVDAKSLNLLHGNYSRVGFYHPGPVFFQLMAWVEIVFYDGLGLVGSPVGAQILAALLVFAASIAALYCSLLERFEQRIPALVCTLLAVAITCNVIDAREFYNGQLFFLTSWPPFLAMGAMFFFVAGIIALQLRRSYGLPLTTTGLMMLVHGHASFVGLAPLMVLLLVFFIVITSDRAYPLSTMVSDYVRANRVAVAAACVIFLLFCLPILLNTLLHWPGELPKYFTFAGQRETRTVGDMLGYWKKFAHWSLLPIPAFLALMLLRRRIKSLQLIFLILLVTLPAGIFYSFKGLDTLDYKYPLFWLAPALSVTAALALLELVGEITIVRIRKSALVSLIAASFYFLSMFNLQGVFESINSQEFVGAIKTVRSLTPPGKLVWIEVDTGNIIPIVYTSTLAVIDKRLGGQSFCVVEKSWNIAYTEKYRCDPANPPAARLKFSLSDGKSEAVFKIANTEAVRM